MTRLNETILKYNAMVPRYTSYPTAPHFSEKVEANAYRDWLQELPEGVGLSLYLHIPFCPKLCWYCGCHTKMTQRYAPVEDYIHLLKREIRIVRDLVGEGRTVEHIHFGGGSPTILSAEDFTMIMEEIRKQFHIDADAEIAIEIDPRGVTESKAAAYASCGINRASIGAQDFHKQVQEAINREQPFHVVYDAARLLQQHGIESINLDLMYGLPHQTVEGVGENITYALAFNPSRIALFGYAHVPWMKKQMRLIPDDTLPDSHQRLEMFQHAAEKLKDAGYFQIGLDHFAREDDSMKRAYDARTLRRNFQGYTTDTAEALIGLGVSSISKLPQGYAQNTLLQRDYEAAMKQGLPATVKGIALSDEDTLRQQIIEQLMCYLEVDVSAMLARHQLPVDYYDEMFSRLAALRQDGLIEMENRLIRVKPHCRQIVRNVCAAFDEYLGDHGKRHAQVA